MWRSNTLVELVPAPRCRTMGTSPSLDGDDDANSCDDAGVHYCFVTVTGPLSFTLKP